MRIFSSFGVFFVSLASLATVSLSTVHAEPVVVGSPAPIFSGKDASGATVDLAAFKGKNVVLEWFNPTCPFVKKFYSGGDMQRLQEEVTAKGDIWLTIDSSAEGKPGHLTPEEATSLIAAQGLKSSKFILDTSGTIGKMYGARTTPHMFVIDATGVLAYAGAIDSTPSTNASDIPKATNYVRAAVKALKSGQKVEPASTDAYGCSVKY